MTNAITCAYQFISKKAVASSEFAAGLVTFPRVIGLAIILILLGLSDSRIKSLQNDVCNLQMQVQDLKKKTQQGIQPETFQECLDSLRGN
jgi:hypothetical protein